jgi:hypothetical protein
LLEPCVLTRFPALFSCAAHTCPQVIGVDSTLFMPDIAVLVAMYGASCIFVTSVLAWKHRVRNE